MIPLMYVIEDIAHNNDLICIRAQKEGKWGSHALSELSDRQVAEWIRDHVLPAYLEDPKVVRDTRDKILERSDRR